MRWLWRVASEPTLDLEVSLPSWKSLCLGILTALAFNTSPPVCCQKAHKVLPLPHEILRMEPREERAPQARTRGGFRRSGLSHRTRRLTGYPATPEPGTVCRATDLCR